MGNLSLILAFNFTDTLLIMILVIFGFTAFISLGSIPDWIKIPEWYKKKLFTVLIVEVAVIVLAALPDIIDSVTKYKENNPENTETGKSVVNIPAGTKLSASAVDSIGYFKVSADAAKLDTSFYLRDLEINSIGFFNDLKRDSKEQAEIEWKKEGGKKWKEVTGSDKISGIPAIDGCPYYIIVIDSAFIDNEGAREYKVGYQIYKKGNRQPTLCTLRDGTEWVNKPEDDRMFHCFRYTDENDRRTKIALFYISKTELNKTDEEGRPIGNIKFCQRIIETRADFSKLPL